MDLLEIEVKFAVVQLPILREKIIGLGAISKGRHFETNVRFDDAAGNLHRKQCLLRLRKDAGTTLTFKSRPDGMDPQFKIHRELEVRVSDFDGMEQILLSLGFERRQVYEKWRESFSLDQTHLCIDQMPFGDYLEIEGTKTAIRRVASQLGLNWSRRICLTYLDMFAIICNRLQLTFSDITFENFADVSLPIDSERLFIEA